MITERIIAAIERMGGIVTREQCQQLAREFGYRNINWLFGGRRPRMVRLADDRRMLAV